MAKKGCVPWNKGMKGMGICKATSGGFKKGYTPWIKGKHHSKESRKKMSDANIGKTGKKSSNWKGGKIKQARGYVLIYSPDHPLRDSNKYVLDHRLLMEKHLGRYLTPKEVVHHINGDTADNRIENLKLFANQSEHLKHDVPL